MHVVTQEVENERALGNGLTDNRKLYYKELVSRFGHHPAIIWNMGEESTIDTQYKKDYASYFKQVDAYGHIVVIHSTYDTASTSFDGLLGHSGFDGVSIQGTVNRYNEWANELRADSSNAGRKWLIFGDENAPAIDKNPGTGNRKQLRKGLWGNICGGGSGAEWYAGYIWATWGDLTTENFALGEPMWAETKYAVEFFNNNIDLINCSPRNDLVTGSNYCLARPGTQYVIYLPSGGTTNINLGSHTASFSVQWFNPRSGGGFQNPDITNFSGGGPFGPRDAHRAFRGRAEGYIFSLSLSIYIYIYICI